MNGKGNRQFRLSGSQSILLGFLAMILAGTLLLMLPISTRTGEWTSFTNAFFTATSASCVTGLVLYDTASHWSIFGQVVILTMIQIGGMGVVTMTTILSRLIGRSPRLTSARSSNTQDSSASERLFSKLREPSPCHRYSSANMVFSREYGFPFFLQFRHSVMPALTLTVLMVNSLQ